MIMMMIQVQDTIQQMKTSKIRNIYLSFFFYLLFRHGTRCAGEVAMVANNSICGVGIA
jgi:hypothetical protein